jgi:hypothetical protein
MVLPVIARSSWKSMDPRVSFLYLRLYIGTGGKFEVVIVHLCGLFMHVRYTDLLQEVS